MLFTLTFLSSLIISLAFLFFIVDGDRIREGSAVEGVANTNEDADAYAYADESLALYGCLF